MKIFRKGPLSGAEIVQWLQDMRAQAHVPQSGFAVSAVFRVRCAGVEDYYFAGVNVENAEYRLSTHGEEGAIAAMVTALGKQAEIIEGWVMGALQSASLQSDNLASCCGKCRQQIAGFAAAGVKIHSVAPNGSLSTTTVGAFLPDPFSFRQFVPEPRKSGSSAAPAAGKIENRLIRNGSLTEQEIFAWLAQLESVDYASKRPQSIVLQLDNGSYVAGVKVEEAAFNGMSAAQCALAVAVSAFGMRGITGVWADGESLNLSALQTLSAAVKNADILVCEGSSRKTFAATASALGGNLL